MISVSKECGSSRVVRQKADRGDEMRRRLSNLRKHNISGMCWRNRGNAPFKSSPHYAASPPILQMPKQHKALIIHVKLDHAERERETEVSIENMCPY